MTININQVDGKFIAYQCRKILRGEITLKKIKSMMLFVLYVLSIPMTLSIVLIIRALRPFVLIRFGALRSDRIGHYASNTDLYLCQKSNGETPEKSFDIFHCSTLPEANEALTVIWRRCLRIWQWSKILYLANELLPGWRLHCIVLPDDMFPVAQLQSRIPAHAYFSPDEIRTGWKQIERIGIQRETKFICLNTRSDGFLNTTQPDTNWDYHSYRNTNSETLLPAISALVDRGYKVVRMGLHVGDPLVSRGVVDYATSEFRTPFLDLFLAAHCHFFVGDSAGLVGVPLIFRRPTVCINLIPMRHVCRWLSSSVVVPKALRYAATKDAVPLEEYIRSGAFNFLRTENYAAGGYDVVDASPEILRDAVIEMDDRLAGRWQETDDRIQRQARFWAIMNRHLPDCGQITNIADAFLESNPGLC
ncbi:TIGR04372 family glycosyltransferase [Paramagnetospirillum magneticum]|uniref:TIGR04372 family glycosyltransferase n=1 Tax=Paramagnetospirillum magneticum TaxID=84159 RepID=UPI000A030E2E|nr:TIGR04372 family glycosyltransferase [Paramagnetospirillum magneticum]